MKIFFLLLFLYSSQTMAFEPLQINNSSQQFEPRSPYKETVTMGYSPNIKFSGSIKSILWGKNDSLKLKTDSSQQYSVENIAMSTDAEVKMKVTNKNNNLGINYGADIQLAIPLVKGYINALNKTTRIFINGAYGEFSVGYQNGTETYLKVASIIAGSPVISNVFRSSEAPYYVSPVLFTESIANLSNPHIRRLEAISQDRFAKSLPMRISFITPNFMGAKIGMSYTPKGYSNTSLFRKRDDDNSLEVFSNYNNIISGGISYKYSGNKLAIKYSMVGQYAKARLPENINYSVEFHNLNDLLSSEAGASFEYLPLKIKTALSYGYLGKSGIEKNENDESNLHNYYYTFAMGKQIYNKYLSIDFLRTSLEEHIMNKLGMGVEYQLDSQKILVNQCKIFLNCDFIFAKEKKEAPYNEKGFILTSGLKMTF